MYRVVNPLLKNIIHNSSHNSEVKSRCIQYLKSLRSLQFNGYYTVYFGETSITESLITGVKCYPPELKELPTWKVVHAGSSQGWVPWKYRLVLQNELPMGQQEDIFQDLCLSVKLLYGNCVIVVKEKDTAKCNLGCPPSDVRVPHRTSDFGLQNVVACPEVAKNHGHELLFLPSSYSYLHPLDTAWSSLKWFIMNNRKEFSLISHQNPHTYQCIFLSDLIGKGMESVTPSKWKVLINKVRRWENHYLHKCS
ncbi:uncharacterized protein C21orf140 homolog [Ascaphus truei]|uniref:uncharacterized protein C21orf140 homolog n=1 Tax=Ascaphus truei TaxID=8439 RepID=UPI003F5A144D